MEEGRSTFKLLTGKSVGVGTFKKGLDVYGRAILEWILYKLVLLRGIRLNQLRIGGIGKSLLMRH